MKKFMASLGAITVGISLGLGIVKILCEANASNEKTENDSLISKYRAEKMKRI